MKTKRLAGLLALLLALFLPATAFAAENDDIISIQWKKISGKDFYIDELDGVKAYPQYQCNDFAIRYYQEVFDVDMFVGVTPPFLLRNLFSEETGFVITDEPKKGDIAYWPMEGRDLPYAHTAIIKSYEDGVLTLIEQNWNWNNSAAYQRKVKFPSDYYDVYTLAEQPSSQSKDKDTGKSSGLRLKSSKDSQETGSTQTLSFPADKAQESSASKQNVEEAAQESTKKSTKKSSSAKGQTLTLSQEKSKSSSGKLTLKKK